MVLPQCDMYSSVSIAVLIANSVFFCLLIDEMP